MRRLLGALLLGLALVAGCAAPGFTPDAPVAVEMVPPLQPQGVEIPAIDARSSLVPTGRTADGGWEVPPVDQPEQASWYTGGPVPGSRGPATILGHINGGGRPGVFAKLAEVPVGAPVFVYGADGRMVKFRVTRVEQVPKAEFDGAAILAPTVDAELRLISCGGAFNRSTGHYDGSVIAYAVALP